MNFLFNINPGIKNKIVLLYPNKSKEKAFNDFAKYRIKLSILVFLSLILLAFIIFISSFKNNNTSVIERGDYGSDSKIITRKMSVGNIKDKSIDIEVFSKERTSDEINKIFDEIQDNLPKIILGKNEDLKKVRHNLNLVREAAADISIYWSSDNDNLLENDGKIHNLDIGDAGCFVKLKYSMRCNDNKRDGEFLIKILPPAYSEDDAILESLNQKLILSEKESRKDEKYVLPTNVNNLSIKWEKNNSNTVFYICILAVILSISVYILQEKQLDEKLKYRKNQLLSDYYEIANKLILYIEVGISAKSSFNKIAQDYIDRKKRGAITMRYAYEEILVMCRSINSGLSEFVAYEECGKRCELMQYKKLFGYISQSVKKGAGFVIEKLKAELLEAFELRKANAIRMGEEASTKLMLPMVLMLSIIIAILIIPAFISFGI